MGIQGELLLAHEECQREDQERRWANRHRSKREGFHCWGGVDCPRCNNLEDELNPWRVK